MIKLLYFNNIHNSVCLASHISERWSLVLELSLTSYINSTLNQYPGDKMSNVLTTKKKWQLWDLIEVLANLTVVIVLQYINVSDQHTVDLLSLNVSDPLWPHGRQHTRPPCPSLTPRIAQTHVCWGSDAVQPSHPLPPSSLFDFSLSQHQGLFHCLLFPSGGQSIGTSASAWVPLMNIQGWFPLGLTGLISLLSEGLSRVFSSTTVRRYNSSAPSVLYRPALTSIHDYWKNHSFD